MDIYDGRTTGVIVARFQVPDLHAGHLYFLKSVVTQHHDVLVVLGSPEFPTPRNPLPFATRERMVLDSYPAVKVLELRDHPSNEVWSSRLDELVQAHCDPRSAVLYGSRDSFLGVYSGTITAQFVPELPAYNGTDERKRVTQTPGVSSDFRRGVIYGFESRLAVTRPMVDVAVLRPRTRELLLAGKETDPEGMWRFIGGLVDPTDASLEWAAVRELSEEAPGIWVGGIRHVRYLGSARVDDWRYRESGEGGVTSLFLATYAFGHASPGDDISRLAWISYEDVPGVLVQNHQPLWDMLKEHLPTD